MGSRVHKFDDNLASNQRLQREVGLLTYSVTKPDLIDRVFILHSVNIWT